MQKIIAERMVQFGQAGHAGDYASRTLDEMQAGYAS